jgi:hypothetical protein
MIMKGLRLKIALLLVLAGLIFGGCKNKGPLEFAMIPDQGAIITGQIQKAIDNCGASGGGTVFFPAGKYITGGIHLKSNVTLRFEKGAVLEGSSNLDDYGNWKWSNAMIMGDSLKNIAIVGEGVLDGIDLTNPKGEGGFRGPHCIRFTNCDSIIVADITITRSANWAMNFRHCGNGSVKNVKVRGGHDALHTRFCNNFDVRGCDFRTGDDCFAGNDNRDFYIENCLINTSCNAFRFGCLNLVAKNCSIWGPGEFVHIEQNRNNTLSAFTHFSPDDENPKIVNGNWSIQGFTIHNVDQVFNYNFKDGLWQTGQPATTMVFANLNVTDVKKAFYIVGDLERSLKLTIRGSSFSEYGDSNFNTFLFEGRNLDVPAFFNANHFGSIEFHDVAFITNGNAPVLNIQNGNHLLLQNINYEPAVSEPKIVARNVKDVTTNLTAADLKN